MRRRTAFAIGVAAASAMTVARNRRSARAPAHAGYDSASTRVLIAGGGFGGLTAAKELARRLHSRPAVAIRVIDASDSMTFWPMVPEVVSGSIQAAHVIRSLREELSAIGVEYVRARLTGGDLSGRRLTTTIGEMTFDKLVLSVGWRTNFFGTTGAKQHSLVLESVADAVRIRARVIDQLEAAAAGQPHDLTFVVVGGGSTGVELAAGLADLVDVLAGQYPTIDRSDVRVVLAQSKNDVLPHMEKPMRQAATSRLVGERIEVRTDSEVREVDARGVVFARGDRLDAGTVIWAAGVEANPVARELGGVPLDMHGRVAVDEHLRIGGANGLYALGDVAAVRSAGSPVAPTAQAAVQEAAAVAANVAAEISGGELAAFRYHELGKLVELGGRFAVSNVFGLSFTGWAGQLLWRAVYLYKLGDWRDRLHVLADWAVRLLEPPGVPRLRVD
jgi:NADH dehydrogenase